MQATRLPFFPLSRQWSYVYRRSCVRKNAPVCMCAHALLRQSSLSSDLCVSLTVYVLLLYVHGQVSFIDGARKSRRSKFVKICRFHLWRVRARTHTNASASSSPFTTNDQMPRTTIGISVATHASRYCCCCAIAAAATAVAAAAADSKAGLADV